MGLSLVSQVLLVLLSVLALTRTQSTTQTPVDTATTETATTESTTDTTTYTTPETTPETTTDTTTTTTTYTTPETTTETTTDTTTTTTPETTTDTTTTTTPEITTDTTTYTTPETTPETTTDTTTTTTTYTTPETTTETTTDTTTTTTPEITTDTTTYTIPETTTDTTTVLPETTTTEYTTVLSETTTLPITSETTATTTVSSTIPTTTAWTAPAIFYPFGPAAGDGEQLETGYETFVHVPFSSPFTYFGRKYNDIYVNNNGLITFNQPLTEAEPYPFPTRGAEDFIAPLWTDLDDFGIGKYWFQQYTSGSVLTRASQDINQYFPHIGFSASWVFVATWDYANTANMNEFNLRLAPTITFQVVLISGGGFSFILMNYGDCAAITFQVEAGYDTINSTDYHVIHYEYSGYSIPNLKNTSNVNVPGRWAFLVNNGTENVLGVQVKLRSFLDLTQNGAVEVVLQQIKQKLVDQGVSSFFEMKLRTVKKTQP